MKKTHEDTPRTIALALAVWALAAAAGALEGIFTKLSPREIAALATFAFAFATATTYLDTRINALLSSLRTRSLLTFAIEADLAIAVASMLALGFAGGDIAAASARFPLAFLVLFAVPVAAIAHVRLLDRILRRRPARAHPAALSR